MPKRTKKEVKERPAPAATLEGREQQLINYALNLVEERLLDGTASAQETVHFLKLASRKETIEREIMERQAQLITAKTDAIETQKSTAELYKEAAEAMVRYSPTKDEPI